MNTPILLANIASLLTIDAQGAGRKSGAAMQAVGEITDGAMLIDGTEIRWVGTMAEAQRKMEQHEFLPGRVVDCSGKTVLPGFVDSHTHVVFAGNRSDEFARRLRGVSYQSIAAEGGGILRTMQAVRNSSVEELAEHGLELVRNAMRYGTSAIEIKSGYGLSTESELKQLRAIRLIKKEVPIPVSATFLGAHDFPPEYRDKRDEYVRIVCEEMMPVVAEENLAEYCDVFTDVGYYTVEQTERIFDCALKHGLKLRVHADEFGDVAGAAMAARYKAASADHLLKISSEGIAAMRESGTVATLLPGTAYFLALPYADARAMIAGGLCVALATDCNPGSCFTENMQLILSMACTQMKMTIEEAMCAATLNGAAALGAGQRFGSLEAGKAANFIISDRGSYKDMVYHFGINHVRELWVNGKREVLNA